jgi:hypothetical protein
LAAAQSVRAYQAAGHEWGPLARLESIFCANEAAIAIEKDFKHAGNCYGCVIFRRLSQATV